MLSGDDIQLFLPEMQWFLKKGLMPSGNFQWAMLMLESASIDIFGAFIREMPTEKLKKYAKKELNSCVKNLQRVALINLGN